MRISDWSSDVCSSDLHQQIVPTGRRDLPGALGGFLPFDLFEIRPRAGHLRLAGLWRGQAAVALVMVEQRPTVGRGGHPDRSRPRLLGALARGAAAQTSAL